MANELTCAMSRAARQTGSPAPPPPIVPGGMTALMVGFDRLKCFICAGEGRASRRFSAHVSILLRACHGGKSLLAMGL